MLVYQSERAWFCPSPFDLDFHTSSNSTPTTIAMALRRLAFVASLLMACELGGI